MTMSTESLKALRADLDKALAAVAKAHNVSIELGSLRFDAGQARATLTAYDSAQMAEDRAKNADALAERETTARKALQLGTIARVCGADPTWAGRTFLFIGETFEVIGLMPYRLKYPMLCKNTATGKTCVFTVDVVRAQLT